MSYPQPIASESAVKGAEFWRLNTTLVSGGDCYESDATFQSVVMGPLSDISKVRINYYDPSAPPSLMNEVVIAPDRPHIGRIDAALDKPYPQVPGTKGRILITPYDVWDPSFRPAGFVDGQDAINLNQPVLDVIGYFKPQISALASKRPDKVYDIYQVRSLINGRVCYTVIPFWGRKYAFIDFTNYNANPITYGILGVNYSRADDPAQRSNVTTIRAAAAVASGTHVANIVTATTAGQGMFDVLLLSHQDPLAASVLISQIATRVVTSDAAQ